MLISIVSKPWSIDIKGYQSISYQDHPFGHRLDDLDKISIALSWYHVIIYTWKVSHAGIQWNAYFLIERGLIKGLKGPLLDQYWSFSSTKHLIFPPILDQWKLITQINSYFSPLQRHSLISSLSNHRHWCSLLNCSSFSLQKRLFINLSPKNHHSFFDPNQHTFSFWIIVPALTLFSIFAVSKSKTMKNKKTFYDQILIQHHFFLSHSTYFTSFHPACLEINFQVLSSHLTYLCVLHTWVYYCLVISWITHTIQVSLINHLIFLFSINILAYIFLDHCPSSFVSSFKMSFNNKKNAYNNNNTGSHAYHNGFYDQIMQHNPHPAQQNSPTIIRHQSLSRTSYACQDIIMNDDRYLPPGSFMYSDPQPQYINPNQIHYQPPDNQPRNPQSCPPSSHQRHQSSSTHYHSVTQNCNNTWINNL